MSEHTRAFAGTPPDDGGPRGAYCDECSRIAYNYVPWPCPHEAAEKAARANARLDALEEAAVIATRCAGATQDFIKEKGCRWVADEIRAAAISGGDEVRREAAADITRERLDQAWQEGHIAYADETSPYAIRGGDDA